MPQDDPDHRTIPEGWALAPSDYSSTGLAATGGPNRMRRETPSMALESAATLVLACYNHASFVDQALVSVASQTQRPQLIVTDDASSDDTVERLTIGLRKHNLDARQIIHSSNAGLCRTFNEALAAVDTPFVAFLSADDWMEPQRIEQQTKRLQAADDRLALVHSDMIVHDDRTGENSLYSEAWKPAARANTNGRVYREIFRSNFIATPSVMLRTEAVRNVGGFDEQLPFEDYDLYLRLARDYSFEYDPAPLVHYRRHGGNMTDDASTARKVEWLKAIIRINEKHFGQDPEIDRLASVRNFDAACQLYKSGVGVPRDYTKHFLRYARHHRAPKGIAFALLGLIGVPGPVLPQGQASKFWER